VTCRIVEGAGPEVLLLGDSHAGMITPMMRDLAERRDISLSVGFLSYCPWTWGTAYAGVGATCHEEQRTLFEESVPALDPDVVVLAHRPFDDPIEPLDAQVQGLGRVSGAERTDALRTSIDRVVESLRRDDREVVIVEPIPIADPDANPLTCLSEAEVLEECRFVASPGPLPEERLLEEWAARDGGVHVLDLDRVVCPYLPICDPVVNGVVVRRDANHLTLSYAREVVAEPFETFLDEEGLLTSGS
jgi:SGNH domain (fused to AT3 domains)